MQQSAGGRFSEHSKIFLPMNRRLYRVRFKLCISNQYSYGKLLPPPPPSYALPLSTSSPGIYPLMKRFQIASESFTVFLFSVLSLFSFFSGLMIKIAYLRNWNTVSHHTSYTCGPLCTLHAPDIFLTNLDYHSGS